MAGLDDERALARLEHSWLEPPEYRYPTCDCGNHPKYDVLGRYFCECCISDIAEECLPFDSEWCEYCGEEGNEGYRVNGDFYCKDCFEKSFSI